jgi:asparagine synthase (glutamine-hydrolysing)
MCGILCVFGVHRGAETVKSQVLERARRLRHRGPDWSGLYLEGKHIIAHERLSIVGVDDGAQPLFNEEKNLVLAVNGEIYNHKEVQSRLTKSSKVMTASDCEVIIHLYEEHGFEGVKTLLNELNGMWAFCLLDVKNDRYLVARDHMGIIPLYLGRDADGSVWVSSELKALHDVCVQFEDFPPGHFYDSKSPGFQKWYDPDWHDHTKVPKNNEVDLKELREQFEAAVVRQLMCDVPYGVLLSGGLDSSLVSAIAARHAAKRVEDDEKSEAWFPRLHSFSIGLENSPDLAAAKKVAEMLGTVHHSYVFTVEQGINAYRDVIYHLETYDVTTIRAATPMYLMARKIKSMGVKMVLSGEGADEMFGGYLYFHKCPSEEEFQKETVNKVKGLYKFDCLRANKSLAAFGVEGRVPFLDKEFLDYSMRLNTKAKMCGKGGGSRIEKHILRAAFEGYLPKEVLWRQKEQFSDGVGYSWIDSIQAHAEKVVSDLDFKNAKFRFPHNTPATKEAYYIRETFEGFYPERSCREAVPGGPSVACSTAAAILWDESFKSLADNSGRSVMGVHNAAYDEDRRAKIGSVADEDSVKAALQSNVIPTIGTNDTKRKEASSKQSPKAKGKRAKR